MSLLADKIEVLLKEAFPLLSIKKEYTILYKGQRMYVDFYIPSYLIAIEVHGRQHDRFVEHFHKDAFGWREHQKRDRMKEEWADVNNISYVIIRENNMPKDKDALLKLVRKAL